MKRFDERSDGRLVISVHLTPRSSRDEIAGWNAAGCLKIYTQAAPVEDAANHRLVAMLAASLGVPKADVVITSGASSRTKRVAVPSRSKNRLLQFRDL
jgi:uncharacterized protein (TIGR00251 family)